MRQSFPLRDAGSVHQLYVHLVFITKMRKETITLEALQFLREIFNAVCVDLECRLISCNSDWDHVHVLVQFPPKIAISLLVNRLKGVSSRRIHERNSQVGSACKIACNNDPLRGDFASNTDPL